MVPEETQLKEKRTFTMIHLGRGETVGLEFGHLVVLSLRRGGLLDFLLRSALMAAKLAKRNADKQAGHAIFVRPTTWFDYSARRSAGLPANVGHKKSPSSMLIALVVRKPERFRL